MKPAKSPVPQTHTVSPGASSQHDPFTWFASVYKGDINAKFIGMTLDVCHGMNTCLEVIQSCDLQREIGDTPLLSQFDTGRLLRLAITTSNLLSQAAEAHIKWMNEFGEKAGKS